MGKTRRVLAGLGIVLITACGQGQGESPGADGASLSPSTAATLAPTASASGSATAPPTASAAPAVKAGEAWVAFQWVDPGGSDGIFLVRPDGTGLHQVADMPGSQRHPDWSPDGSRLVVIHTPSAGGEELWVIDAAGANASKVLTCDLPCNEFNYPDWADDGSIYYGFDADATESTPPTTFGVARLDLDTGTSTTVLTRTDGMTAEQPRISPDGTRIAFDRGPIEGGSELAIYVADVADVEGEREQRLTDPAANGAHPDWLTDDRIVFNTYDLGFSESTTAPSNLFSVGADGTGLEALTTYGENELRATQPRVTPDGTGIVYTQVDRANGGRTLWFIASDGSGQRSLTPQPISGTHPQLRPVP